MTNEAVLVQQLEDRLLEVTVADGTAITKGCVLKLSDPNIGAASSADGDIFLGIATGDKVANDGQVRMAVWRHGVFDMKCQSGTGVTCGDVVKISGANTIFVADDDIAEHGSQAFGIALQTGAANEVIEVLIGES